MFKPFNDVPQAHWIWNRIGSSDQPECILFQKAITYRDVPNSLNIHITADTTYVLYVNGRIVGRGPAKSQTTRYYDTVDIAPYLHIGENVLTVQVVHYVGDPHMANRFEAGPISMPTKPQGGLLIFGNHDWQTDTHYQCASMKAFHFIPAPDAYMYLGFSEEYDARETALDWAPAVEVEAHDGYFLGGVDRIWRVEKRTIPQPFEKWQKFKGITRASNNTIDATAILSEDGMHIPAHTTMWVELDAGAELTAFPLFEFIDGTGSRVEMCYAECYGADENGVFVKKDRTDFQTAGQYLTGITDVYIAGQGHQHYQPFTYKAFRYIRIQVQTEDTPLRIQVTGLLRTGYPLEVTTSFSQMTEEDHKIWEISHRTLQNCMYDTYMDCPHYERMQYVMDTFLQMQYSCALSCDDRLIRKAIMDIGDAQRPDGLIPCCVPSNLQQIIPGFSLFFVFMLKHYYSFYGKKDLLQRYFFTVERILWFFEQHLNTQKLLCGTGYWQFTDWVKEWHQGVPIQEENEPNGIQTMMFAYALKEAADIANVLGYTDMALQHLQLFDVLKETLNTHLYDCQSGLYRNTPMRENKSQHAQIWAVLAGIAEGERAKCVIHNCLNTPQIAKVSFCMEFYLFRALEQVGEYAASQTRWKLWRDMLPQQVTTWPEDPVTCRSECHAWSAVPLYEYTHCGLGITPAAPGFAKVRVSPRMLWLRCFGGRMHTPAGTIEIAWATEQNQLIVTLTTDRPMEIVWELPGFEAEETVNGTVQKQVPFTETVLPVS